MIVIGSYAAELNNIHLRQDIRDIDIFGSAADLERFRSENRRLIAAERVAHGSRSYFKLENAGSFKKVEFDIGQTPSDLLLEGLGSRVARVLNSDVKYPPPNVLYLIKRGHANRPVHFEKTTDDLLALTPHLSAFTEAERQYYSLLREESDRRFATRRAQFFLGVHPDDLLTSEAPLPAFRRADVLAAIAGAPSSAHAEKRGRSTIDEGVFEGLDFDAKCRAMREVFMANGIERFHAFRPDLPAVDVYRRSLRKTVRDLLPTRVQDFCLDNFGLLDTPPDDDFIARFEVAREAGRVVTVDRPPQAAPTPADKAAWELLAAGRDGEARAAAEDLVRRADLPGDSHALHLLGVLFSRGERKELAERCFRKSLFIRPQNARAWAELGVLLRTLDRPAEAVRCLEAAVARGTSNADVHVDLGLAHEALGDSGAARACYATALRLKPKLASAQESLARLGPGETPG